MARDVSNFSTIGNSIIFLVQIIRGYGCVVRFLVQICESDHVYKADAMKKLEENFKEKILRKVFIYFHTFPDQKVHSLSNLKSMINQRLERTDEISFVDLEYMVSSELLTTPSLHQMTR